MFKPYPYYMHFVLVIVILFLSACEQSNQSAEKKVELLIYCGITMVYPISEIIDKFEKKHNVKITITQGGSEELYQNLKSSQKGDLYLPGSDMFRTRYMKDGLFDMDVELGYNQAAIIVAKNNPKKVAANLNELLRKDLSVVIASAELGSIGVETKKILIKKGIYQDVLKNVVYQSIDSRTLNRSLKSGDADVIINWKATAYFRNNRDFIEVIALNPEVATPKRLTLNLLKFSRYPQLSRQFMDYAHSSEGLSIFKKYGFSAINDFQ